MWATYSCHLQNSDVVSILAKGKKKVECLGNGKSVDMTWGNAAYSITIILNTQPVKTRLEKNEKGLRNSLQLWNYAKA